MTYQEIIKSVYTNGISNDTTSNLKSLGLPEPEQCGLKLILNVARNNQCWTADESMIHGWSYPLEIPEEKRPMYFFLFSVLSGVVAQDNGYSCEGWKKESKARSFTLEELTQIADRMIWN